MNKRMVVALMMLAIFLMLMPGCLSKKNKLEEIRGEETTSSFTETEATLIVTYPEGEGVEDTDEEELKDELETTPNNSTKETQPKETQPKETQPKETQPKETQPKETQPKETQPKETQPKETQPKETQPKETQPKETQPTTPGVTETEKTPYEEYLAMTPQEQQAFYETFASPEDFVEWLNAAKDEYEEQNSVVDGYGGSIDIGDFM